MCAILKKNVTNENEMHTQNYFMFFCSKFEKNFKCHKGPFPSSKSMHYNDFSTNNKQFKQKKQFEE